MILVQFFGLLNQLDIDSNQQYPISEVFYKKPVNVDMKAKVIKLPGGDG